MGVNHNTKSGRVALPESALSIAKKRPHTWLIGLPNCGHNMLNERGDDIKKIDCGFYQEYAI